MAALILYLTEPGTTVRKRDERLVLSRNNKVVGDFPLINVAQVIVVGNGIELTSEVTRALAIRKIPLAYFSGALELVARVEGEFSLFGKLRFLQARFVDNPANQLGLARLIMRGKLLNQNFVMFGERQSGPARRIAQLVEELPTARDLNQLRGFEGQAAAIYFEGLRKVIPQAQEWGFERREYNPPPDPINALLSLAYTMASREAMAAVNIVGFDPHLGCFHAINYGRPSLALDMVEEFRPVMDQLVIYLLKEGKIRLSDFDRLAAAPPPRPMTGRRPVSLDEEAEETPSRANPRGPTWRLKPEARNRFLAHYEELMRLYFYFEPEKRRRRLREIIEEQVRQVARLVLGESSTYIPFVLRQGEERRSHE